MSDNRDLTAVRREYQSQPLDELSLELLPQQQFDKWFRQHSQLDPDNATAMVLATATAAGAPAARVVLLKHYDEQGFCWYSDQRSQKGAQLAANPQAELLFYWPQLDRQIRIHGRVERLRRLDAEHYFAQRPRGSQLSAAASCQSAVVTDRDQLESDVETLAARYQQQEIPCPDNWGGYRLIPKRFEFWQGRENRLHDRLLYDFQAGQWLIQRLAP